MVVFPFARVRYPPGTRTQGYLATSVPGTKHIFLDCCARSVDRKSEPKWNSQVSYLTFCHLVSVVNGCYVGTSKASSYIINNQYPSVSHCKALCEQVPGSDVEDLGSATELQRPPGIVAHGVASRREAQEDAAPP